MENVVYILGAGFSAPLGLPVMSNFFEKANEMYFSDRKTYRFVEQINGMRRYTSFLKNYFQADMYNIEEFLSILEMSDLLSSGNNATLFKKYVKKVIQFYSPKFAPQIEVKPTWYSDVFGRRELDSKYVKFVFGLCGLSIHQVLQMNPTSKIFEMLETRKLSDPPYKYSIVSLNYDEVLESAFNLLEQNTTFTISKSISEHLNIYKLHGTVSEEIIQPTWNKMLVGENILQSWKAAFKVLEKAHHIRILGYSLPITDAYIRYLIKSAVVKNDFIKSIDVICIDDKNSSVKNKYDEFIQFGRYSFYNADILDYLGHNFKMNARTYPEGPNLLRMQGDSIELAHKKFTDGFKESH